MAGTFSILIGADIVPTKTNVEPFERGDISALLNKPLQELLLSKDARIFNLETPLADNLSPIEKCGPCLSAPSATLNGIKNIHPSLLTLANNHILDQGDAGLFSTMNVLQQNGIPFFGVGKNLQEAAKPYVLERHGIRVGFYACVENEFSVATQSTAGANPFDPLEILDAVADLKTSCDFVVVLYHGGKEEYRYPSPNLQKLFRKLADKGADLVIAQHTHCIGCSENYKNSVLVYGQGNFLFDHSSNKCWQTGMLIDAAFSKEEMKVEYIPLIHEKGKTLLADKAHSEKILGEFIRRSENIKEQSFLKKEYQKKALEMEHIYLEAFYGCSLPFKILRKIFRISIISKIYPKKKKLALQNFIECEAHRELLLQALK